MIKGYDVVALGELLIDFTPWGTSPQGHPLMEANPGGAPGNVLAMLAGLGHSAAFIGKVGTDSFGDLLAETLERLGINTQALHRDPETPTTLAFVHNGPEGERSFSFYRSPGADLMLMPGELPQTLFRRGRIFHFGSLSLTHDPARQATRQALILARSAGLLISFDPNLRLPLWETPETARGQIHFGLANCHLLKLADNELAWLTGTDSESAGLYRLTQAYPGIGLVLLTKGSAGCVAVVGGRRLSVPGFPVSSPVDTTGAGDCFLGAVLHGLLPRLPKIGRDPARFLRGLSEDPLWQILRFANAAAALVTERKGALSVMPKEPEIQKRLAGRLLEGMTPLKPLSRPEKATRATKRKPAQSTGRTKQSAKSTKATGRTKQSDQPAQSAGRTKQSAEPVQSTGRTKQSDQPTQSAKSTKATDRTKQSAEPAQSTGRTNRSDEPTKATD